MVLNSSPAQSLSLCYCYAHEDAALLDELDKHLAKGANSIRSNRDISEGDDWRSGMDGRLDTANLLLLLVSEHLIDSGYCDSIEMQEALKRYEAGKMIILPVILRPVDWEKTALRSLQTFPHDGQPILNGDDVDEAFERVATEVDTIAEGLWGSSPTLTALPIVAITHATKSDQTRADQTPETSSPNASALSTTPLSKPNQTEEPETSSPNISDIATISLSKPAHIEKPKTSSPDASDIATTPLPKRPQAKKPEVSSSDVPTIDTTPLTKPTQVEGPEISLLDTSTVATVPFSGSAHTKESGTDSPHVSTIDTTRLPAHTKEPRPDLSDVSTIPFSKPAHMKEPGTDSPHISTIDTTRLPVLTRIEEPGTSLPDAATIPFPKLTQTKVRRETRNPYKGLRAFTTGDAGDFFGRAAFIDALALLIENMPAREKKGHPSSRLLAVIGPAGAGKSSAVMAGLLPSLREGGVFDSADWVYLDPIVPGEHPIKALAQTLLVHFPKKDLRSVRADLQDVAGLHLYSTRLIQQAGAESTHVVLVIDQFEELFTLTDDEVERRRFVNLLVNACTRQEGPLIVILTLRTDFIAHLAEYPGLAALARLHLASPSAPTRDELRAIITQPTSLPDVQVGFEDGLIDTLLADAQGLSEVLPHTQFTLSELFQKRAGDQLTLQAYREIGGVKGALAQRAEQTYRALPSHEHRLATYALFLNLVDLGTAEQGPTLVQMKRSDLNVSDNTQTRQIQESLDTFVEAGLIHQQDDEDTTVEISHEIVMKAWPRLAEWLNLAREDRLFQQTFTRDIAQWEQREQTKTRLYRGAQLKKAQSWARRHEPSVREAAFLQASTTRRSRLLVNTAVIALLLVAVLGAVGGYYTSHRPSPLLVANTSNSGTGSLRWSIDHAPTGSTITFDPSVRGTITLAGGSLVVGANKDLTIDGPGAGRLALRSGDTRSALVVPDGSTLTISGLSFQGSKQMSRSILSNNGVLTLNNSVVSGNSTSGAGGGISSSDGILTLNNSVVSGNTASGNGGGISFFNGTLTLNNSAIMKNTSSTGKGGGLYMLSGILTMRNSTIASNSSTAGGGIYSSNNTLNITNDTIGDNSARDNGGGIFTYNSTITLDKSTVFNNTSVNSGGGIFINSADSPAAIHNYPVVLERSIVAGNHSNQNLDLSGTVVTRGYNLFQYFAGANFVDPQKLHITDKEVGEVNSLFIDGVLDKNGGTTLTHALLAGSPAIDAIPVSACDLKTASTDQRGVKRPQGKACDIGAYEYQAH